MMLEPRAPFILLLSLISMHPQIHSLPPRFAAARARTSLHASQQKGENGLDPGDTDTVATCTPLARTKLVVVVSSREGGNMWF